MKSRLIEFVALLLICTMFPLIIFPLVTGMLRNQDTPYSTTISSSETEPEEGVYATVSVKMKDGSIKQLPMESYIASVVLREMPASFHKQALQAQAVVARTYTVRQMMVGKKHGTADVCAESACCQGYWDVSDYLKSGGDAAKFALIADAVAQTAGQILIYNGKPIDATYFSCSGGSTEDAVAVWGSDVPYLKATDSPGEENATHYTDTVRFSVLGFCKKLGLNDIESTDFKIGKITYTAGGGVDTIIVCGKKYHGTAVRKLLGLRSTAFVISATGNNITITTKGFGHRVGMSQYGADAMANNGKDYTEILYHYYRGVELVSLCDLY